MPQEVAQYIKANQVVTFRELHTAFMEFSKYNTINYNVTEKTIDLSLDRFFGRYFYNQKIRIEDLIPQLINKSLCNKYDN